MSSIVQSSIIIPVRTVGDTFQVYLTQRAFDRRFLPGYHAFFGGAVDSVDADVNFNEPHIAGNPSDAFYAAAIREFAEEAGIFVGGSAPSPSDGDVSGPYSKALLRSVGQWDSGPVGSVQHQSEFFVVELNTLDPRLNHEHIDGQWVEPAQVLTRWRQGEVCLSAPVRIAIECFAAENSPNIYFDETYQNAFERAKFVEGIHVLPQRTPTLPPATHTNCVLVGTQRLVVIDPGSPIDSENERLAELLEIATANGIDLEAILLTHHHGDHTSGVDFVQSRYQLPVWAHPGTAARLRDITVDRLLNDGDVIDLGDSELRCVFTPGHADGHLAFLHEATNVLVGGDLIASEGTILVDPKDGHMGDYFQSLARVRDMDVNALIPAHGWTLPKPQRRLEFYISHREAREEKVLEALRSLKRATAAEIVPVAYDDVPKAAWPLAVRSTMSHLIHLTERGLATRTGDIYSPAPGRP